MQRTAPRVMGRFPSSALSTYPSAAFDSTRLSSVSKTLYSPPTHYPTATYPFGGSLRPRAEASVRAPSMAHWWKARRG
ncbi:MAG: hypothetical protein IPK82_09790 [Polyangiaceae bacterium]|nr:hypothetical protein [Polyangiaceae bacterium]